MVSKIIKWTSVCIYVLPEILRLGMNIKSGSSCTPFLISYLCFFSARGASTLNFMLIIPLLSWKMYCMYTLFSFTRFWTWHKWDHTGYSNMLFSPASIKFGKLFPAVTCGWGPFIFTAVWYFTVEIGCNSCMHSPADGHLSHFPVFAVISCAAINILLNVFFGHTCWFLLGSQPRSGIMSLEGLHTFSAADVAKLFCKTVVAI